MEMVIVAFLLLLVALVALRIGVYGGKWLYKQAPSILAWIILVMAMWMGGVFETSNELDERIQNARNIESIEDKSRRGRSAEQRNDVEVYPQNASGGEGK